MSDTDTLIRLAERITLLEASNASLVNEVSKLKQEAEQRKQQALAEQVRALTTERDALKAIVENDPKRSVSVKPKD